MAEARPLDPRVLAALPPALLARVVLRVGEVTFRVAEEGPIDATGAPAEARGAVYVAHAAELGPEVLGAWGDHFAARRLRSPFDQLARPTALEADGDRLPLAVGLIDAVTLDAVLAPRGWRRGAPDERLQVVRLVRAFGAGDPVGVLALAPGIGPRGGETRVTHAGFTSRASGEPPWRPLAEVPRRVRSEVAYDSSLVPA